MNKTTTTWIALAVAALAGAGGYLAGQRNAIPSAGRPAAAAASAPASAPAKPAERKILYYRNPMGLPDTSPTPKQDSMGMDYIPVYAEEQQPDAANTLKLSTDKVQKLGVRTEPAAMRPLGRALRATGRVEPDERRIALISPRFEGYVERLHVNTTSQAVGRGQPLFEVYSPDLVTAQQEYLLAVQGARQLPAGEAAGGMGRLADASLARLRNWGLSDDELATLVKTGEPRRTLTMRSPVAGIVTEKKAFQGMRFMPGEMLYQVTDLSTVWVVADVPERDIALVRPGSLASVQLPAYPGERFEGRITRILPTMDAATRTVPVRIELANPRGRLKPAMSAEVALQAGASAPVLTVPDSAVIDSGTRQLVLVRAGEGRFEPREVRLGQRGDGVVEVLSGVREGEPVVVAANFLIDAESNLRAAVGGFGAAASAPAGH
ncbi:efflux RND transporter periplasmic adaptor subunit [Ideonella sp.]|uniref:efflux RND transporter periplasmic adaptor subunit n=1 Tax=Ideonella sp. TaxID=1929293 RepID=UPI002B48C2B8|nr:efflux RND transporter periplasmic adaptor subunit [Ideonella sp.]HJV70109.1 efflux RND transporter periplasmic adaptor subunit [Ideonella sp.]